jgi:hypothetical protein
MIDKASPAGWVIQVTIPASAPPPRPEGEGTRWIGSVGLGVPSFQYFNVAIAAADKAIAATSKHLAIANAIDGEKSAVRGLTAGEIAALHLEDGEVRPS